MQTAQRNGNGHFANGNQAALGNDRKRITLSGQAALLQQHAFQTAELLARDVSNATTSKDRVTLGLAFARVLQSWDIAVDRVRVIRGQGKPRSVTAVNEVPKKTKGKFLPQVREEEAPDNDAGEESPKESLPAQDRDRTTTGAGGSGAGSSV